MSEKKGSTGWPFWVLLAAWFCANSPQEITFNLIVWAKGAQHFSHQERLREDVSMLLTGKLSSVAFHAAKSAPCSASVPSLPSENLVKRLDLYISHKGEYLVLNAVKFLRSERFVGPPLWIRSEPLLPPPRANGDV
jgi:hypothetical protein